MDRRFLSDSAVIAASKDFVCVRLMTYESAAEAPFLTALFRTRSGVLENSVYAMLDPTGKKRLTRSGRSPRFAFGSGAEAPAEMAKKMREVAKTYTSKSKRRGPVPFVADARLALNVAACDGLPLVLVVAKDKAQEARIETLLRPLVWRADLAGAFTFARTKSRRAVAQIKGLKKATTLAIIKPGVNGLKGTVVAQLSGLDAQKFVKLLEQAHSKSAPETRDQREHVRQGKRAGVHWETEIPVTDSHRPPGGGR